MIVIIIDNYKGQKYTYTMPDTATVEMISENKFSENGELVKTGLTIGVDCAAGIRLKKEDIKSYSSTKILE